MLSLVSVNLSPTYTFVSKDSYGVLFSKILSNFLKMRSVFTPNFEMSPVISLNLSLFGFFSCLFIISSLLARLIFFISFFVQPKSFKISKSNSKFFFFEIFGSKISSSASSPFSSKPTAEPNSLRSFILIGFPLFTEDTFSTISVSGTGTSEFSSTSITGFNSVFLFAFSFFSFGAFVFFGALAFFSTNTTSWVFVYLSKI